MFAGSRYTPHRRGRWWSRLSLDLAHIRRPSCALWASREGLRDPGVCGGDRLALEKRASMLSARYFTTTVEVYKCGALDSCIEVGVRGLSFSSPHSERESFRVACVCVVYTRAFARLVFIAQPRYKMQHPHDGSPVCKRTQGQTSKALFTAYANPCVPSRKRRPTDWAVILLSWKQGITAVAWLPA